MDSNPQLVMRCADAHHHLSPRRCMDSNPQLVMQCAGAHYHCRPCRCVDINHRRVIRCAGAHHHPRPPPREGSVCQVAYVSQHTLLAGAQHSGQPPHGTDACVKMRAYHNTHYVPVHNIAFDEKTRVRRRYTSEIVTDGLPTHTTTFVHAGAWIVTLNLLCGVPAHTTTVVHAGA